jgi:uncharacterized protein
MKLRQHETRLVLLTITLLVLMTTGCPAFLAIPAFDPPLYKASESGDAALVRKLLLEGADPNTRSKLTDATPALVAAVNNGHIEVVGLLLVCGADVNAKGERSGWTALMRAAVGDNRRLLQQRLVMVILLLDDGADVNARDARGSTPLMKACMAEPVNQEVVRLLISRGADINARDSLGQTALSWALDKGDKSTAKLLMGLGAR